MKLTKRGEIVAGIAGAFLVTFGIIGTGYLISLI